MMDPEHPCLWSKPTCLSMSHLVSHQTFAQTHLAVLSHSVVRSCLETPWKRILNVPRLCLTHKCKGLKEGIPALDGYLDKWSPHCSGGPVSYRVELQPSSNTPEPAKSLNRYN
ncbi:hypothetical protein Q8A67_005967 [Cirrhinus molitorella]|uniref:Uncharacterized protein n=1 Tax=Cirrhinus molitorella TaxID=172907 RepID=A0AA88TSB6_9TELE|nr:hypothetical protein Q8A67_005967 [Cirrhinus molitorella]